MDKAFTEHDVKGQDILKFLEITLQVVELVQKVHFRNPHHDIARRCLNEIREFKAEESVMRATGEWIKEWMETAEITRFNSTELYDMFHVKAHDDNRKGLTPEESVEECVEEIEDFISRYSGVKKC